MSNEPAFPQGMMPEAYGENEGIPFEPGITIRDYFAAKALNGTIAATKPQNTPINNQISRERLARWCYEIADAMILQREQQ